MKTIDSFTINHDTLKKGLYLSRKDGDIITYDVRMKIPNGGDYLPNAAMHTIEHLFATYARNSQYEEEVIYVGPMGCRTGFYILLRQSVSQKDAISLVYDAMCYIRDYQGEIPGCTRRACGNYLEHDLNAAKSIAADMCQVLKGWREEQLVYPE